MKSNFFFYAMSYYLTPIVATTNATVVNSPVRRAAWVLGPGAGPRRVHVFLREEFPRATPTSATLLVHVDTELSIETIGNHSAPPASVVLGDQYCEGDGDSGCPGTDPNADTCVVSDGSSGFAGEIYYKKCTLV